MYMTFLAILSQQSYTMQISDSMFFSILSLLTVFPDLNKNHSTLQPGKFHMSQVKA